MITAPRTAANAPSTASRAPGSNLILVHTPVHASWLNQAEIYFSIVQRKALQPNNFTDLDALEQHLLNFGRRYQQIAQPFEWKFTRQDLDRVLDKLDTAHAGPPARRLKRYVRELPSQTTKAIACGEPVRRPKAIAADGGQEARRSSGSTPRQRRRRGP